MRRLWRVGSAFSVLLLVAAPATARADEADVPKDLPRLVLETGRREFAPPDPEAYRFVVHGEYQLRYQAQRAFTMIATSSDVDARPGLVEDSLGQGHFGSHWLRITPRLQLRDAVEVVGQMDVLTGLVLGETAHGTSADRTPRNDYNGFSNVQPRWLFVQYRLPFGVIRIGQQPNHWGMGLLANDGDHPTLFGDYRYGSISERILFATKPGGKDSEFTVALAGDLVFSDQNARLTRGDHAFQGVLGAFWERGPNRLGLFSTVRHQENDKTSGTPLFSYTDEIDAVAIDLHGKVAVPIAADDAYLFAEAEAATILGSTNLLRTQAQALDGSRTQLRSYGGAATLGVVHQGKRGDLRFGDVVAQVEMGYASGDADPHDGVQRRFVFDPNHRVGLLLFDEVLRWQTARSASAAQDPLLSNAARPTPGVELLPTQGGVSGAQYVNPTAIFRPRPWLDLKAGTIVAQSTSDVVDPYRVAVKGSYQNYRGGTPRKKDLGLELDMGFEARVPLEYDLVAQFGAQGGLLLPGSALENAEGSRLPIQWIAIGRFGLQF
jgi:hypothetical protein